jgi:methyl-accepting chemotaxis protein
MSNDGGILGLGRSLARKAAALTAVMVVVGVAALLAMQFYALRATAIDSSAGDQRAIAGLVADQIAGPMKWGKADIVAAQIDKLTGAPGSDVAHVVVRNAAGAVVHLYPAGVEEPEVSAFMAENNLAAAPAEQVTGAHVLVGAPVGEFGSVVIAWDLGDAVGAAWDYTVMAVIASLVVATAILITLSIYMTRAVATPMQALSGAMTRLAAGDLDVKTPGAGRSDELGAMARAVDRFRAAAIEKVEMERDAAQMRASAEAERQSAESERAATTEAMSGVVSTLAAALGKLADGDLTYRVRDGFPYEYDSLKNDLNRAFESLQDALGRITQNAESVRSASSAIAGAAEDLSSRTESQAASLEQSAAAIDEITATTRKTADGAAHARQVVERARGEAEAGGAVVRDAVQAMSEIENSSEKIGQIIGVIDEIAFQTNLLALNAGVEAARAGEAGRGFAVVASEVRALAQRSADAAKQIKDLILSSKAQVERGVELVDGAGSALERIISGVAEIDGAVSEIAISAQEQATGLVEVSTAVGQMDQFTQQNAAMVEQVTAQVRELSRQASEFADLVGGFRTGVTIRPAAPAKSAAPVKSAAPRLAAVKPAAKPAALKPAATAAPRAAAARAAPAASALAAAPVSDGGWEEF